MKPIKNQSQNSITIQQSAIYSGPIPPPEVLANYEKIYPGFADRILKMAEKEQEERIKLDNKIIDNQHTQEINDQKIFKRAYIISFISIIFVVLLCAYGFYLGFPIQTAIIATSVIVSLATVYVKNNKKQETKKDS